MLTGNTVLITGGSSGVGLKLAEELLKNNNTVLICGRSMEKLEVAKRQLPLVEIFQCDIAQEKESIRLYEWVSQQYPACNILIHNAAVAAALNFAEDESALAHAEQEFQTNILAPIRITKLFLPHLLQKENSILITITTGLVYAPRTIYPFYNATKAALHSFTQVLRVQLKEKPIKVIEVLLPAVDTPWHHGNPPKIAISVEDAVFEMISKLNKGRLEIRIGKVKLLYWLARLAPGFAFRKINSL